MKHHVQPRGLALAIVLAAAGVGAGASGAIVFAGWSAPVSLSVAGDLGTYPQVGFDRRGDALSVWTELKGSGVDYTVMSAHRPAGSSIWSAPVALSPTGHFAGFPKLAVDAAGGAVTVWDADIETTTPTTGPPTVGAAFRSAAGAGWSKPQRISPKGVQSTQAQVAIDASGTALAVWIEQNGNVVRVESATGRASTDRWSKPVVLATHTGPGTGLFLPQISVNSQGYAVAAWMRYGSGATLKPSGQTDTVFAAVKPRGRSWRAPVNLGQEHEVSQQVLASSEFPGPHVALDSRGDAIVIWQGRYGGNTVPVSSIRLAGVHRWQKPAPIVKTEALDPHVAVDGRGDATATWIGFGGSVVTAERRIPGCGWTARHTLFRGDPNVNPYPQVAVNDAGQALVSWSGYPARAVERPGLRASWQKPTSLGTAGGDSQVALDFSGDGLAVFQQPSAGVVVRAAAYTASSPSVTHRPPRCP